MTAYHPACTQQSSVCAPLCIHPSPPPPVVRLPHESAAHRAKASAGGGKEEGAGSAGPGVDVGGGGQQHALPLVRDDSVHLAPGAHGMAVGAGRGASRGVYVDSE